MNLKNFLRFFITQSLILLTNVRYVEAFSLRESSKSFITTPLETNEKYIMVPFVAFAEAKGLFATRAPWTHLEINLEGLFSKMEALLSPIAFSLLFFLMLAYWSQAAFFGQEKYKTLNNLIFFLATASLTLLLVFRWIISRHFPLSNLYESLVFLSLCFLSLKAFFLPRRKPTQKANGKHQNPVLQNEILKSPVRNKTKRSGDGLDFLWKLRKQSEALLPLSLTGGVTKRNFVWSESNEGFAPFAESDGHSYESNENVTKPRFICSESNKSDETKRSLVTHRRPEHYFHSIPAIEKKADFLSLGLGVILSPLSLLTFGFAFLSLPKEMQQSTALVPALQSNWLMMHVTVMILSYAALISGSILAIAFLILSYFEKPYILDEPLFFDKANVIQNITPKEKTLSTKIEDSSLTVRLDNYSYRILALGFPLLTIGIISGAVWANEAWGSYWSWDPKETWALITWLVFAIYLHTRITKGWSGKKPAIVASAGFFMVWFCYLGVNLLGTGLHSYGWFTS